MAQDAGWARRRERLKPHEGADKLGPCLSRYCQLHHGPAAVHVLRPHVTGGMFPCLFKLEFWSEIKASEVWIWENKKLHAFVLSGKGYQPVSRSKVLPGIDLKLIEELAEMKPHSKAVREFQKRSSFGTK